MENEKSRKIDSSIVEYSNGDIKRNIKLPTQYSEDLAYFCGILAGDGHIETNYRGVYKICCAGNPADEKELYHTVLLPIIKKLFNLEVKTKSFSGGTFGFKFGSKAIVFFLTKILDLPANKKYIQLKIPKWVKTNMNFIKAYIRGLADTDFCLSLKKRYGDVQYSPVITGASKSKSYMEEVAKELESLGIKISRSFNITRKDTRFKSGIDITHRLHIYGHTELIKWMRIIGFCSPKHLYKFDLWKIRNMENNRLKTKNALKEAELIKNLGWKNQPKSSSGGWI
tara:strand:+ start:566 stop:1414 length:849 start_codon:yes stop_codon:yes gene_type:complete